MGGRGGVGWNFNNLNEVALMAVSSLMIVGTDPAAAGAPGHSKSAAEEVFAHWVWMLGKNPRRTKMGPVRLRIIERALALYDTETLLLAIDGCAASKWHAGGNDREREFTDIELIMRDEAHVERFAEEGEVLRERALRALARQAQQAADVQPIKPEPDAETVQAQRQALRTLAAQMAGRRVTHG
jgi:hypothetical protein